MPIMYDSKKIIPAPLVSIQVRKERFEDGRIRRTVFQITLEGKVVLAKGSPNEDGDLWASSGYPADTVTMTEDNRLAIMREKQGALVQLLDEDGHWFEIQPYDGTPPIKFKPRIGDVQFQNGNWFDYCNYSVSMEADTIFYGDREISGESADIEETWAVDASDEKQRSYKLTHQVTATRRTTYLDNGTIDDHGWELAKIAVADAMGGETAILSSFIQDLTGETPYNHVITENIDISGGKYSINETWLLYDGGAYIEDYQASVKYSKQEGYTNVSVSGSVTGLSTVDGFGDRWTNAQAGWATVRSLILGRAQTISGITLVASPQSKTEGSNPLSGTITYDYEYSTKGGVVVSGALWDNISVTDSNPVPIIAEHVCIAREIGPVFQDIGTVTKSTRSLTIEVQMGPASGEPPTFPSKPSVTDIITENTPTATYQGPFLERDEETWSKYTGRYNRNVSWKWL